MHEVDELGERIWEWRARTQPRWRDDIPRLVRPVGWLPPVGVDAVEAQRAQRDAFRAELDRIHPTEVGDIVDHRLLRSALARVTWEVDVVRHWQQPRYYTDQALGPVFDALLPLGVDASRVTEVARLLANVPPVLDSARPILTEHAAVEFARTAIDELDGIDARVHAVAQALANVPGSDRATLESAASAAATALVDYRAWLIGLEPSLIAARPVGPAAFEWFLREVACIPLSAETVRSIGRRESDRAVALERLTRQRYRQVPEPQLPPSAAAQVDEEKVQARRVRDFYMREGLLSQPSSLPNYLNSAMPDYLEPLRFLGVADDLGDIARPGRDGVSYVPAPTGELPYFYAANARDPRAGIVHEGVHYQQLTLSAGNPRPVRRHYYDSGANEGIAFYNEEMMLAAGLFADAPHSQITMYNFMRLRALRVEIDVGLATGDLSIAEAAELLRVQVPMDALTAVEEAAFFAETPGQALTYQIGKSQLFGLIADATRVQGDAFSLHALHDMIWLNGNVPIALLRWELLGLTDELAAIGVTA